MGLYSENVSANKIYLHAYDWGIPLCLESGGAAYNFGSSSGRKDFMSWLSSRVKNELLLHVLDELGVIDWVRN